MKPKKYAKIITTGYPLCAIYEPHPFRSSFISEATNQLVNTGVANDEWCWVYYDWCCNAIGIGYEKPDGIEVDKFTTENLDFSWTTPECAQRLVNDLNVEDPTK